MSIDPVWVFGGIALLAGVLLGVVVCRRFTPTITDVDELRVKLEQSRSELEGYRASVNGHFNKTSDLVNDLTQDFVKVYRHLAEGAQTLSDAPEFSHVLEQQKGKVLILNDDEADPQDIAEGQAEDTSAQADQAEAEKAEVTTEVPGPEDIVAQDDDREEPLTDADVFEPTDVNEDDREKAKADIPADADKRDPVSRTDTQ